MINSNKLINDLQQLKFNGSLSVFKDYFFINTDNIAYIDIKALLLYKGNFIQLLDKNAFLSFVAVITTSSFNDVAKTTTKLKVFIVSIPQAIRLKN